MPELLKRMELNQLEYYETHLSLVNCLLPPKNRMTPTEIKVLAAFMSIPTEVTEYKFGPIGRKIVMKKLELSPAGLSNYIRDMIKEKKLLIKQGDVIKIWPILIPQVDEQEYRFKLINIANATVGT